MVSTLDKVEEIEIPAPAEVEPVEAVPPADDADEEEEEEESGQHFVTAKVRGKMHRIEYDRYLFTTPKMMRKLLSMQKLQGRKGDIDTVETMEILDTVVQLIARVVVSWDVTGKDGTVLPIAVDAIEDNLDMDSLTALVLALQEDVFPGEAKGSASPTA